MLLDEHTPFAEMGLRRWVVTRVERQHGYGDDEVVSLQRPPKDRGRDVDGVGAKRRTAGLEVAGAFAESGRVAGARYLRDSCGCCKSHMRGEGVCPRCGAGQTPTDHW